MKMVLSSNWKDGNGSSEKLINPGKNYLIQPAADFIQNVNSMRDKNGLSWSRKP
jgi:hypothetical protein